MVRKGMHEVFQPDCGPKRNRSRLKGKCNSRLFSYFSLNKTGEIDVAATFLLFTPAVAPFSVRRFRLAMLAIHESTLALAPSFV